MNRSRFFYLAAFVGALFFMNNAGAKAYECGSGPGGLVHVAALSSDSSEGGHLADAGPLCAVQCARGKDAPAHPLANNGPETIPAPIRSGPVSSVRIETTTARIALTPQAASPPLPILFGNLRN